jgi:hypothetical protein
MKQVAISAAVKNPPRLKVLQNSLISGDEAPAAADREEPSTRSALLRPSEQAVPKRLSVNTAAIAAFFIR